MPSTPVASINVSLSASRRIATADGLAGFFLIPWSPDTVSPAATSNSLSSVSPTSSGKLFGNPRGDGVSRLPALFPDDSPQHRLGREQSSFSFEILPRSGEQGGSLFQPARLFVEELLQAALLARTRPAASAPVRSHPSPSSRPSPATASGVASGRSRRMTCGAPSPSSPSAGPRDA